MGDTGKRPYRWGRKLESHSERQKVLTQEYALGLLQNQTEPWENVNKNTEERV